MNPKSQNVSHNLDHKHIKANKKKKKKHYDESLQSNVWSNANFYIQNIIQKKTARIRYTVTTEKIIAFSIIQ